MAVKTTRTVCVTCHARCGAIVHSEDGKIVKVGGRPEEPAQRKASSAGRGFPNARYTTTPRGASCTP